VSWHADSEGRLSLGIRRFDEGKTSTKARPRRRQDLTPTKARPDPDEGKT